MLKKILKKFSVICYLTIILSLTSCVETVVVASLGSGAVAIREKSLNNTQKDVLIASKLGTTFLANGLKNPGNSVDITVNEGRVLLTGIVRNANKAKLAQEYAWKVENVKEVIDEIQIRQDGLKAKDFSSAFFDYLITWQLESKLLFSSKVHSINYKITTVDKTVYFLGVARDDAEMQNALDQASKIKGVKKVVNHLLLINDVKRK
ncbi:MAG: putative periplasmic or secreted lipoprotein [Pseudomonadota bacterium]|jgi:osmotically-inducible protein OsmY